MAKSEQSVNMVWFPEDEVFRTPSDYELTLLRSRYNIVIDKGRVDEKKKMFGHFYIALEK